MEDYIFNDWRYQYWGGSDRGLDKKLRDMGDRFLNPKDEGEVAFLTTPLNLADIPQDPDLRLLRYVVMDSFLATLQDPDSNPRLKEEILKFLKGEEKLNPNDLHRIASTYVSSKLDEILEEYRSKLSKPKENL